MEIRQKCENILPSTGTRAVQDRKMLSARLSNRPSPLSRVDRSPRIIRASAKTKKSQPAVAAERDPQFIGNLRIAVVVAAVAAGENTSHEVHHALVNQSCMHELDALMRNLSTGS